MERTLTALRQGMKGDIYVYLCSEEIGRRFLQDAENEGFTIDGGKPTAHEYARIMALHDGTIHYVGFVGNVRFGCGDTDDFHRVDYAAYISGTDHYMYRENKAS